VLLLKIWMPTLYDIHGIYLICLMLRRAVAPDVAWSRQEQRIRCRCWCQNGRRWLVWDNGSFYDIPTGLGTHTFGCSGKLLSPNYVLKFAEAIVKFPTEMSKSPVSSNMIDDSPSPRKRLMILISC
jgi:hypothetical protein